tara:strand:- start:10921 stop:11748 length:828 start_codon:yes stop_codon:yes gene_type:complete
MSSPSESQVSNAEAEKHQYYTQLLSRITAIEGEIYKKITKGEGTESEYTTSLQELKEARKKTLQDLITVYEDEQAGLVSNARVLTDQKTNYELLKHQLNEAEKELDILKDNKLKKQRLTRLGEWEYDRYRSHRNILKVVVYGTLAILLILMAMTNIPFFPSSVGVFAIFLILCIIVYSVIGRVYENIKRRNHYWKKFDYSRYMKNEPVKEGDGSSGRGLFDLDSQCAANGFIKEAKDAANKATTDGFANMIIPETLSRTIQPSNVKNYENYSTLF